jgi:hypothetical protein
VKIDCFERMILRCGLCAALGFKLACSDQPYNSPYREMIALRMAVLNKLASSDVRSSLKRRAAAL